MNKYARMLPFLLGIFCLTGNAIELNGLARQGGLLIGQAPQGVRIEFQGRAVRVADSGVFLIALGREAPSQMELVMYNGIGEKNVQIIDVAQRDYPVQRVEGVPEHTVTPPQEAIDRIRNEAAMVSEARSRDDVRTDFAGGFIRPLNGEITGVYGSQRIYNGVPKRPHYGLDIAAPEGTPVRAPAPGVVTLVHPDMYFSGGTLIIDHGHGLSSTFIHLSQILVTEGQRIEPGQLVAKVGATGRATGPHLDWRINWFDVRIDPQLVLQAFPAVKPNEV